jgi:hypothetical protein
MRRKCLTQIADKIALRVGKTPKRVESLKCWDLIHCQKVVERMLTDGRTVAEVEEYVEHCGLDEMAKAGLWMLAWAHQDQATQLRRAKEALALVSSMRTTTA